LDSLRGHLETLNISTLAQWDVLAFIYTYGTSLTGAEDIGQRVGYDKATVAEALDSLTSAGLTHRSRSSRGVRLYQMAFIPEKDGRSISFQELVKLAGTRGGRLLLTGFLRRAGAHAGRRARGGLHVA
jgi:DNA-binding transcriptional ArsR family regulator